MALDRRQGQRGDLDHVTLNPSGGSKLMHARCRVRTLAASTPAPAKPRYTRINDPGSGTKVMVREIPVETLVCDRCNTVRWRPRWSRGSPIVVQSPPNDRTA
jgi:hypothetical protein